VNRRI